MNDLDGMLSISREIEQVNEKLMECELRNIAPKNQLISDMPKGKSRTSNEVEDYVIHKTALLDEIERLKQTRLIMWLAFLEHTESAHLTHQERLLLSTRFVQGEKWKNCALVMRILYPSEIWNENRCYRVYSEILHKIRENNCIVCL